MKTLKILREIEPMTIQVYIDIFVIIHKPECLPVHVYLKKNML